jgi:HPt (histidine-containing phosphotransfer) domain-containing protein
MSRATAQILPYLGVIVLGMILCGTFVYKHRSDRDQIKANYISDKALQTTAIATKVEEVFKEFYQGLRTMTLLPGVKNIDRYGESFQLDSKKAMQQIYNNTYSNVTLSEVYLLPKELNPERIDPNTKKPEEPILTFDEFIVAGAKNEENTDEQKPELEEVEIYEYRLMSKQLMQLRENYPSQSSFQGLNVPAVMGEPVVTCDNSEFTQADLELKNDKPRLGLVYTLPVYNEAGAFHGAVSGVVRVNVLERLLPKGTHAISSRGNSFLGVTEPLSAFEASKAAFEEGRNNTQLIYSEVKKLNVVDSSAWEIWAVAPLDEFSQLPAVKQADLFYHCGIGASLFLVFGLSVAIRNSQKSKTELERKVKEKTKELSSRNHDMRLILDNANEGFLTCTLDGSIGSEYSSIIEKWFGKPTVDTKLWDLLMLHESKARRAIFKSGWSQFVDGYLPFEVCADQMPSVIQHEGKCFSPSFMPIYGQDKELLRIMVVIMNITAKVEADRKDRLQQELLATFQALSKDRAGFLEYFADAEAMIKTLNNRGPGLDKDIQFRIVHTLKGNSAQFGLITVAEACHELESKLRVLDEPLTLAEISFVTEAWEEMSARLINLIGSRERKSIELDLAEYNYVLQRIKAGATNLEIAEQIELWRFEPAIKRLDRMAEHAKSLADRLKVENLEVFTSDNGVRLDSEAFSEVWSTLIHVIRNAIDHGFSGGKTDTPCLHLSTNLSANVMELSVKDNGQGIDWDKVREKAKAMSLPCSTASDLEACLFADGLSTKNEVTSVSGRGVGMAALKQAVSACGGTIKIISKRGQGTEFKFLLPIDAEKCKVSMKKAA